MQEHSSRRRFLKKAALAGGGGILGAVGLNQISPGIWREPMVFELNRSYWARSQPPQNPPLTENIVLIGGASALQPGQGFKDIYTSRTLFSLFCSVKFTF